MSGPLAGIRVVEMASAAPGPFAAMMLASGAGDASSPGGARVVLRLAARADG